MSELIGNPEQFNPAETSTGFTLYEHWEESSPGTHYLLSVSSTPTDMELSPGDAILERKWAPASEPKLCNRAAR